MMLPSREEERTEIKMIIRAEILNYTEKLKKKKEINK
jgi:hypothetical protein